MGTNFKTLNEALNTIGSEYSMLSGLDNDIQSIILDDAYLSTISRRLSLIQILNSSFDTIRYTVEKEKFYIALYETGCCVVSENEIKDSLEGDTFKYLVDHNINALYFSVENNFF